MSAMRIALVHNEPDADPAHAAAERGVLGQVQVIAAVLHQAGHAVRIVAASCAESLCADLVRDRPELVFNCCESLRGRAALEMNVAALFELLDLPFTGSPPLALALALDKARCKALLRAHGIPTPPHVVLAPGEATAYAGYRFPLIVKPVTEDGSIGIDVGAVVHDEGALARRVRYVWEAFGQAALVEEFIDGREFNVALLTDGGDGGLDVLPIGEIVFDGLPPGRPAILDYDAKWNPRAPFRQVDASRCPAAVDVADAARMGRLALAAAAAIGIRDYARVELRRRAADGALFVIEVNPNPDLNLECELMRCARADGRPPQQVILALVEAARARRPAASFAPRHGVS